MGNHFIILFGMLAVLGQAYGDLLKNVPKEKLSISLNICDTKLNWALIPHPVDCHKFYVCANHIPEEMTCRYNQYFNKDQLRCVPGSCTNVDNNKNKICLGRKNLIRTGIKGDCQAFEFCENGIYVREKCEDGSFFNQTLSMCTPIIDTPQHMCRCVLPPKSILKNSDDCSSYYVCEHEEAILKRCQRNYFFNPYLKACVIDFNGICLKNTSTMSSKELAVLKVCKRMGRNNDDNYGLIFQPDANDCRVYYKCTNGRALKKYCPDGTFYNRESRSCEQDTYDRACKAIRNQVKVKKIHQVEEKKTEEYENKTKNLTEKNTSEDSIAAEMMQNNVKNLAEMQKPENFNKNQEEKPNGYVESDGLNSMEMKLLPSNLKFSANSQYKKLASKFISF